MTVLIAARKSNKVASKTGDGIGLDTQDTLAGEFAERNGYDVAGVARDTISGTVAPMDRRELGRGSPTRRCSASTTPSCSTRLTGSAVVLMRTSRTSRVRPASTASG